MRYKVALCVSCVTLWALGFLSMATAEVTEYQAKGNLETSHDVGCNGFSELNSQLTPADLYGGVGKCLQKGDFDNAAQLFSLAGVYATYDKLRVTDATAHQAHTVLTRNAMAGASTEDQQKLFKAMSEKLAPGTTQLAETCSKVRAIGAPSYHPRYMIQHGMGAFTGAQGGDGLKADFNSASAWEKSLETYLHCPPAQK